MTLEDDVDEVVDLCSRTSSEVEFVRAKLVHESLTPQQEVEIMKNEEKWGHLYRIQDRQLEVQVKVSAICQSITSMSWGARCLRHRDFAEAVHGLAAISASSNPERSQPVVSRCSL